MNTQLVMMAACTAVLLAYAGCLLHEGAYRGRVIDEETRSPVKDVVALGVWYDERGPLACSALVYCDAREAVTDEQGDFVLPGQGFRALKGRGAMRLIVFKAGYSHASGLWGSFGNSPGSEKFLRRGDALIIPVRKLSREERKRHDYPSRPPVPLKMMRMLTREINKDRIQRGLDPLELQEG